MKLEQQKKKLENGWCTISVTGNDFERSSCQNVSVAPNKIKRASVILLLDTIIVLNMTVICFTAFTSAFRVCHIGCQKKCCLTAIKCKHKC